MIGLPVVIALALSVSGPLSLYVKDGARLGLEIAVDSVSARHGIQAKAIAAQAEEELGKCGLRVDPPAPGTVSVSIEGSETRDGFVARVVVRARHQSVVNGSVHVVQLYYEEKAVPGVEGEEAVKVKAYLSKQLEVLCGTEPREPTESTTPGK